MNVLRNNSSSKFTKFSEKLTFLTPSYEVIFIGFGSFISYVHKIFRKTNVSYRLIRSYIYWVWIIHLGRKQNFPKN